MHKLFLRYENDPLGYLSRYVFGFNCRTKEYGYLPFMDFQKECVDMIHNTKYSIFTKSRQMFLSTTIAGYIAWKMMFKPNTKVAITSCDANFVYDELGKIELNIENSPLYRFIKVKNDRDNYSRNKIVLNNGSEIHCVLNEKQCKGFMYDIVSVGEFGLAENNDFVSNISYLISRLNTKHESKLILHSSVGNNSLHREIWDKAKDYKSFSRNLIIEKKGNEEKDDEFKRMMLTWKSNPYFSGFDLLEKKIILEKKNFRNSSDIIKNMRNYMSKDEFKRKMDLRF